MITKFDDLPNEIIFHIMEYISSVADVYRAFIGLNQRFENLLRNVHLNIDICWEDQQYLMLIRYFASNCVRLRVFNTCPTITLIRFPRLRSLTMTQPTDAQINSIRSTALPMLEYLASPATTIIFDQMFGNNQQRWCFLRVCHFFFTHIPRPRRNWQPSESICTISGITCSRMTLSQLLRLVPCLRHLRVDMISDDHSNWILPVTVNHLVLLRISFTRIIYEDLQNLIGPCLRQLYLEVYDELISIDFAYLGAVLILIPHNLKKFNCDYRADTIHIDQIRRSHFLFRNMQLVSSFSNDIIKLFSRISIH